LKEVVKNALQKGEVGVVFFEEEAAVTDVRAAQGAHEGVAVFDEGGRFDEFLGDFVKEGEDAGDGVLRLFPLAEVVAVLPCGGDYLGKVFFEEKGAA